MLLKLTVLAAACLLAAGCSIKPTPITKAEQDELLKQDRINAFKDVEPVGPQLTLHEAVARGLKYNLEHRAKMMEQAIALGASELSNFDMLPKLTASAGYYRRNEELITNSKDSVTGKPALNNPYISTDPERVHHDLGLTWNILDFGVSYFSAKQNADRLKTLRFRKDLSGFRRSRKLRSSIFASTRSLDAKSQYSGCTI